MARKTSRLQLLKLQRLQRMERQKFGSKELMQEIKFVAKERLVYDLFRSTDNTFERAEEESTTETREKESAENLPAYLAGRFRGIFKPKT